MAPTTPTTPQSRVTTGTSGPSNRVRDRSLAVAGAAGMALAVWIVADAILGIDLRVSMGFSEAAPAMVIGPALVAANAVIASLAGWGLLAALERFTSRAAGVWTAIALVATLLSLSGPVTGGLTTATTVTLVIMHLVVAAVLIPLLRRTTPAGQDR